jgi:hypothetical protein
MPASVGFGKTKKPDVFTTSGFFAFGAFGSAAYR